MNIMAILALISKGITVVEIGLQLGKEVAPAIDALKNLVTGAQQGDVSEENIAATEELLDKLMADFNAELPPETGG